MRAKQRRLRWPAGFWNVAGPIFIVLAMTHQGSLPPPSYIGSDNERTGFGVTTQISDFDVSLTRKGVRMVAYGRPATSTCPCCA